MAMTAAERVKKSRLKNDRFTIYPTKAEGAEIRTAAARVPGRSVSGYILEAVRARMERERPDAQPGRPEK